MFIRKTPKLQSEKHTRTVRIQASSVLQNRNSRTVTWIVFQCLQLLMRSDSRLHWLLRLLVLGGELAHPALELWPEVSDQALQTNAIENRLWSTHFNTASLQHTTNCTKTTADAPALATRHRLRARKSCGPRSLWSAPTSCRFRWAQRSHSLNVQKFS